MQSYNFVVIDLVNNQAGELLAVSKTDSGFLHYWRTIRDGKEIDEEPGYCFKRKGDIKKIRPSKAKSTMIDTLNLWIMQENISFIAASMERAAESLATFAEKNGINISGERWYEKLPEAYANIANAARLLDRGDRAYNNYSQLVFTRGAGYYDIQLARTERWKYV